VKPVKVSLLKIHDYQRKTRLESRSHRIDHWHLRQTSPKFAMNHLFKIRIAEEILKSIDVIVKL